MEKHIESNENEEKEIIKRPKNYPFCHNSDTVVNNGVSNDTPHFETSNIYKYC